MSTATRGAPICAYRLAGPCPATRCGWSTPKPVATWSPARWVSSGCAWVPDPEGGETLKAVVVPAAGAAVDEAALIAFTRDRLAHYKSPTSVSFVPALPRNPNGKILKRQLRSSFMPRGWRPYRWRR
jgi:hypothetical protein